MPAEDLRAWKRYVENNVNIVLSLLSIVQGLAFADLMGIMPSIIRSFSIFNTAPTMYFGLCLVIVMRILQTYLAGVLYYEDDPFKFTDLFLIFVSGTTEYLLFEPLRSVLFNRSVFNYLFALILTMAFYGYVFAYGRAKTKSHESDALRRTSLKLQWINMSCTVVLAALALFVALSPELDDYWASIIAITSIVILVFNISFSLDATFGTINKRVPNMNNVLSDRSDATHQTQQVLPTLVEPETPTPVRITIMYVLLFFFIVFCCSAESRKRAPPRA